jgi:hypothetical protein
MMTEAEPDTGTLGPARQLASWTASLRLHDIPDHVADRAKHLILDGLGCALIGAQLPWSRTAVEAVLGFEGSGGHVIIGWGKTTSAPAAALLNGTFIQGFELDDFHPFAPLHSARRPAIVERGGVRYGFLQRTSVYWPTDHAADARAPGVAPLMGHTAYEAPMYRYSKWLFPANRPGIPPQIITWANKEHLDGLRSDIEALRAEVDVVVASFHWGLGQHVLTYMEDIAHAAVDAGADLVMGHGPHEALAVELRHGKPIFYGLGSFSFHTGHLGIAHGDWVGLLASVEPDAPEPEIALRFVRHNDANETYLSPAGAEKPTVDLLGLHSLKYGTSLKVDGDTVRVTQG